MTSTPFAVGSFVWWDTARKGRRLSGEVVAVVPAGCSAADAYTPKADESWRYPVFPGRTRPEVSYVVRVQRQRRRALYWATGPVHELSEESGIGIPVTVTLPSVDWVALRRQKEALLFVSEGGRRPAWSEGLLSMLDCIQDSAATALGEAVVFGVSLPGGSEAHCEFCVKSVIVDEDGCCTCCGRRAWIRPLPVKSPVTLFGKG